MRTEAEKLAEEAACAENTGGKHVPARGEIGYECKICGKHLFRYSDDSPEARATALKAERLVEEGFSRGRRRATPEEIKTMMIEMIDQAEAGLIELAERTSAKTMSIVDVLQLLSGLRSQVLKIE